VGLDPTGVDIAELEKKVEALEALNSEE